MLFLAVFVLLSLTSVTTPRAYRTISAAVFEHKYPGFVDNNLAVIKKQRLRPPSPARDSALRTALCNVEWAREYMRTGIDPNYYEMLEYEYEPGLNDDAEQRYRR